ncbi:MAG: LptF/LptG family permease [Desulfomonilaceae bacterium]
MVRPAIINRYVFREVAVSVLFCFAVFLAAGLIAGFLPLLQKGMEAGLGLTLILFQVLISALPATLVTVLPLSMMIGILLGLGRMAADNEVAAIKSAGISVLRLLPPVLFLGLLAFILSLVCTLSLIPKGISAERRLMREAATQRADAGIEERTFFDSLKNLILYVEEIDSATGVMSRVFIRESSQPDEVTTILAQKGKVIPDPSGKAFILNLRNGTVLKEDRSGGSTGSLAFESYVYRYPLARAGMANPTKSFEEMSIAGVRDRVRKVMAKESTGNPAEIAYIHRVENFARILIAQRFIHPLACIALALIAFPLGVLNIGRSRLNNVPLGLVMIFIYYAFTLATERMARSGLAPPEFVLPLPPLVFIIVGAYFIRCVQMERIPWLARSLQTLILQVRRNRI